jgi:HK97 family phage major capsid protein
MDPELKKILDELRALIGSKNTDLLARVNELAKQAENGTSDTKAIRAELDQVKKVSEERDAQIKELQQKSRVQAEREGVVTREQGLRMLGIQFRSMLAAYRNLPIDQRFAGEAKELQEFRQRATLDATTGDGTYLLPTALSTNLIDTLEQQSDLMADADLMVGLPGKMDIPTLTGRPTFQHKRAGTDTAMTASTAQFSLLSIDPEEGYIFVPVDNKLLMMSAIDLGSLIYRLMTEGIAGALSTDLISGDGTDSYNGITGFLNEATDRYVHTIAGPSMKGITAMDLLAARTKSYARARANGKWYISNDVLNYLFELDRTGKVPVITYSPQGVMRIFNNDVRVDEGLPTSADDNASTAFGGFGDLSTYLIGIVGGVQMAVSEHFYFNRNQTCFRATVNYDIARKPVPTFITLKTAAAQQ